MSAHTPGPWKVEPKPSHNVIKGLNGECVADVWGRSDQLKIQSGADKANAALIAAAPDLLAALEAIVNETMAYPPAPPYSADSYLPSHLIEQAQAALKKARGEA